MYTNRTFFSRIFNFAYIEYAILQTLLYSAFIDSLEKYLPPQGKFNCDQVWIVNVKTDFHYERYINK